MRALWLLALLVSGSSHQDQVTAGEESVNASPIEGDFLIERGDGEPALLVRRDEVLTYVVEMKVAFVETQVGQTEFRSWVVESVDGETGHYEATFTGEMAGYVLDHRLRSSHDPSGKPKLECFDTQRGSENRKRQIRIQREKDEFTAVYRFDGHCKGCEDKGHFVDSKWPFGKPSHCESKCKASKHRVWREPIRRAVPEHTLDYLSSIYLIRSLFLSGEESLGTSLLEKDKLWDLSLIRAERGKISVPLGKFACQRVLIEAKRPESETGDAKFSGLFGMKGSMKFWVHETTGVLVQISGELPLGPVSLQLKIRLKEAENAPEGLIALGD